MLIRARTSASLLTPRDRPRALSTADARSGNPRLRGIAGIGPPCRQFAARRGPATCDDVARHPADLPPAGRIDDSTAGADEHQQERAEELAEQAAPLHPGVVELTGPRGLETEDGSDGHADILGAGRGPVLAPPA